MIMSFNDDLLWQVHATSMRRGFEMRNSLREMPPDSTHSIILQFDPETSGKVSTCTGW